jgi:hypothetical protein
VETTYTPPLAEIDSRRSRALVVGLVGLAGCGLLFFVEGADHVFRAWLIAFVLFLGIALGSMAIVMIQHLTGGQWGVFRRIFEASSRTVPLLALLFVPILLGMGSLFPWSHAEYVAEDAIVRQKAEYYLNVPFFIGRAVFYFASWLVLAYYLNRWSRQQDAGDLSVSVPLQRLSGGGLVLYAMTVTFAGVDWIMSLNPHWFSSLFGFLMMGGQGLAALTFTIVIATFLARHEPMIGLLKPHHFHDLGKLSLAFVMLWAYFNFSQYLLTYSANLLEGIPYMLARTTHGWQYLALFLVVFHFAVPFALLLSRDLKRAAGRLVAVALWLLVVRYLDLFMMVSPEFAQAGHNLHLHHEHGDSLFFRFSDLAALAAVGGLWLWMFFTQLRDRPLLPLGDPYLHDALASGGGHH